MASNNLLDIPLSPSTRTCSVCGYVGTVKDVHTSVKGLICCTCLGHEKGSCWPDRFPKRIHPEERF